MSGRLKLAKIAQKTYDARAEYFVKKFAILTLPKGEVYPDKYLRPRIQSMEDRPYFLVNQSGIGFINDTYDNLDKWPSLPEKNNSGSQKFYINSFHYGFLITYFDQDYFDPDYFDSDDVILLHNPLYPAGIVLEKGNEAYVLSPAMFIFVLDDVARMEKYLQIADLPTYDLTQIFLDAFLKELESIVFGLQRTLDGLNFFDPDRQIEIGEENERMFLLLMSIARSVTKFLYVFASCLAVNIVISYVLSLSPNEKKRILKISEKISNKFDYKDIAAKFVAKQLGKKMGKELVEVLAKKISNEILKTKTFKGLAHLLNLKPGNSATELKRANLIYTLLKGQGFLQRAAISSRRLKTSNKYLYDMLYSKNLDMAYWIVEPYIKIYKYKIENEIKLFINHHTGSI